MLVQGNFSPIFRPGLRKDFLDSFQDWEPIYSQCFKESSTTLPESRATIIAGLNRLYERGDGEPVTYDDPKMGPVVQGIDKEYAVGFMLTKRTVEDDQYGKANQAAKWLGHAARLTFEYRAAALLDDAFSGTTFKGIDNVALCSTSHTGIGTLSSLSNKAASPVGLSVSGITALMDLAQNMKDENGDPIIMWPSKLIIGNAAGQMNKAMQIFGSDKEPFTADNQDNAIKKRMPNTKIVMNPYMTSTTNYFLVDDRLNDCHVVIRRPVTMDDSFDFNTDAMLNKVTTRFLVWFVNWRGYVGSNPS